MTNRSPNKEKRPSGFTLVELAVVLVIVGMMLGALMVPLSAQMDQQRLIETRKSLGDIQEALIGYAIIYGRLPCPASAASNGLESFNVGGSAANGQCSNFNNGFVPAATLGLSHVDANGYAVDGWGNRIHYAVTQSNTRAYTTQNGMKNTGIGALNPNLHVCSTSTGVNVADCGAAISLTTSSPAVIYSNGKNAVTGGAGNDEAQNPNPNSANNDSVFVYHESVSAGAANGEFDDQMIWLSNSLLIGRMVAANQLP